MTKKRLAWRVVSFTVAFVLMSLLWLIFEVPYSIRYWFEDRWRFITELWATTGEENDDAAPSNPRVPGRES